MTRFHMGLDLGQARDFTAVSIVECVGPYFHVGHLERLPLGLPYPLIIAKVAEMLRHPSMAGDVQLAVDATGVGKPCCDLIAQAGIPFLGVIITAGTEEQVGGKDLNDNYRSVPKSVLISHVQALLHSGHLKIHPSLKEAEALVKELQNFQINFSSTGYMTFNARSGAHDDLVLALAIAIWSAKRQKTGPEAWNDFLDDWTKRQQELA